MRHRLFARIPHVVVVFFRFIEQTLVDYLKFICHDARIVVGARVAFARELIVNEFLVTRRFRLWIKAFTANKNKQMKTICRKSWHSAENRISLWISELIKCQPPTRCNSQKVARPAVWDAQQSSPFVRLRRLSSHLACTNDSPSCRKWMHRRRALRDNSSSCTVSCLWCCESSRSRSAWSVWWCSW